MPVFGAVRVLAAIELDNQAPLLAREFEAVEAATTNALSQRQFCGRERTPQ